MKTLTIGQKISIGFALILILVLGLGVYATVTMKSVSGRAHKMSVEYVPEASLGAKLDEAVSRTQLAVRSYGFTSEEKYLNEVKAGMVEIRREYAAARKLAEAYPELVKLREHLGEIEKNLAAFDAAIQETETKNRQIVASREKLDAASAAFLKEIDALLMAQNERLEREFKDFAAAEKLSERHHKLVLAYGIRGEGNAARIAVFKAQALRSPQIIAEGLGNFEAMEKHFGELRGMLKVPADIKELDGVQAAARAYRDEMKTIMAGLQALEEIGKSRAELSERLRVAASRTAEAGMARTVQAADESSVALERAAWGVQVVLAAALLVGVVTALLIIRGITRVLRVTADSLTAGAEQIAAAAGQVSSSSQSLAAGASQQAASLEETSASIEEMASMTKRNAHGAAQAKELAVAARHSADNSAASVTRLNTSMAGLQSSSAEVAKIVKTIDEIAFQTNILALNAAVEAARAGEAGMGFAVVAEEVRTLAQRSAQAAKETAEKIEAALAKSEEGGLISQEVSRSLGGIIEQVRKLDGLVSEIAQASAEQSQGIDQVSGAVTQIDQVTQSNAAAAEESASAAEEMNAQTAELNLLVGNLLMMVGGRRSRDADGVVGAPVEGGRRGRDPQKAAAPAPTKTRAAQTKVHGEGAVRAAAGAKADFFE